MDLLLTLDRSGGATPPFHAQLERQLREAIRAGRLAAGTRLPASRELARELGISRGVVVEAYAQLAAEGYLAPRRGAGTVVAEVPRPGDGAAGPAADGGAAAGAAGGAPPRRAPDDLHPGTPDLAAFPRAAWSRSLRTVARDAPDAALGYAPATGTPELQAALARYLGRARGVAAEPARILVTTGLTQGVALVGRALAARGARRVVVEDPGFALHRAVLAHAGLEPVPVPVDGEGLVTDALAGVEADAALVTPAHQAPLGGVLPPERRAALLAWAQARGAVVIEDDYDAEYRYDRDPVGALQGLAPERVVYAGGASKVLAPALRLGWLALPTDLADAVAGEKALDDLGTPVLDQLALADFVERGELDRHLRRMRPRYRARRDALVQALGEHLPAWRVLGAAAGLHTVALAPPGTDEAAVVARARARGLHLHPLSWFQVAPGPPGLVLGYGNLAEPALVRAVRTLAEAVGEASDSGSASNEPAAA